METQNVELVSHSMKIRLAFRLCREQSGESSFSAIHENKRGNERLSGLEIICLMHAAFQRINEGTDVGVDFSGIWPAAQKLHAARN